MGKLDVSLFDINTGVEYKALPTITVDDDLIEHLKELGYDSLELCDFYIEYQRWAKENVEVA